MSIVLLYNRTKAIFVDTYSKAQIQTTQIDSNATFLVFCSLSEFKDQDHLLTISHTLILRHQQFIKEHSLFDRCSK